MIAVYERLRDLGLALRSRRLPGSFQCRLPLPTRYFRFARRAKMLTSRLSPGDKISMHGLSWRSPIVIKSVDNN